MKKYLFLTMIFVLSLKFSLSATATTPNPDYTQAEMKAKYIEFRGILTDNWVEWTTPGEDWITMEFWFSGLADLGGYPTKNCIKFTEEQYQLLVDDMSPDLFFMNLFLLSSASLINPNHAIYYHNIEAFMDNMTSIYVKSKNAFGYNEYFNNLVYEYLEYITNFWEHTGLVYSPLEDLFYIQAGIPHLESADDLFSTRENPISPDNENDTSDETTLETENIKENITEYIAYDAPSEALAQIPIQEERKQSIPPLVVAGISILVLIIIIVIIVVAKKNRTFLSNPE